MRVINARTYQLKEFVEPPIPYAILSHTWGEEEVTLNDMSDISSATNKRGWRKIEKSCELAREMGLEYVWVDTCCIDKSSSAELTEAINSMYRWYQDGICIAFLEDLPSVPEEGCDGDSKAELSKTLAGCRWFSRGWTLQELIAPRSLIFFDTSWKPRGNKHDLCDVLSKITGIPDSILKHEQYLSEIPVARRMSWASSRQTTRAEDLAYCLFGIFDVNMPLIYGEGEKAFMRLQEAIALSTEDFSLFAWSCERSDPLYQEYRGMFARSPREFAMCRKVVPLLDPLLYGRQSFTMTNRGLEFQTALIKSREIYYMNLLCNESPYGGLIMIYLKKGPRGFARFRTSHCFTVYQTNAYFGFENAIEKVQAPKDLTRAQSEALSARIKDSFRFRIEVEPGLTDLLSPGLTAGQEFQCWDPLTRTFFTGGFEDFAGILQLELKTSKETLVIPEKVHIIFGLVPKVLFAKTQLRAWVTPYCSSRDSTNNFLEPTNTQLIGNYGPEFQSLVEMWKSIEASRDHKLDYSNEILRIKAAISADIGSGYSLPKALVVRQGRALASKVPKQLVIDVNLDSDTQPQEDTRYVLIRLYTEDVSG